LFDGLSVEKLRPNGALVLKAFCKNVFGFSCEMKHPFLK